MPHDNLEAEALRCGEAAVRLIASAIAATDYCPAPVVRCRSRPSEGEDLLGALGPDEWLGVLQLSQIRCTVNLYSGGRLVKTHPRQPPGGRSTDRLDRPNTRPEPARSRFHCRVDGPGQPYVGSHDGFWSAKEAASQGFALWFVWT